MRVSPIIGRAGGAMKTYPEFQAYIAAQATGGSVVWFGSLAVPGSYRIVSPTAAEAPTFTFRGTSWGPSSSNGFAVSHAYGAVAHGLPSAAVKDAQMAGALEIFVTSAAVAGTGNVDAVTRNGLASTSLTGRSDRTKVTRLDYFDPVLGPMTMNPSTGAGPTPLNW